MRGLVLTTVVAALLLPLAVTPVHAQIPTVGPPVVVGPVPRDKFPPPSPYFHGGILPAPPPEFISICTRCCASPDWVLHDRFVGPDLPSSRKSLQEWYVETFFNQNIYPALQALATEISANITAQTASLASFIDARTQLDTMRALQKGQAAAIKSYTPSEELCTFGTLSGNLAFTDITARQVQIALSERALDRQLMRDGTSSAITQEKGKLSGKAGDIQARFNQFKTSFCDPVSNNNAMGELCKNSDKDMMNADVDYSRMIAQGLTLDINPLEHGGDVTPDFAAVQALQKNLYAHTLPESMPNPDAGQTSNAQSLNQLTLQNYRSTLARRSVAQNSFANLVAMKTAGLPKTGGFLQAALIQLGLSESEAKTMASNAPSYDAQMDVLTKRLYQTPNFYTGLMDKPDNIKRQSTAMRAIELMQQRDIATALTRSEILMAMILEMKLEDAQRKLVGEDAKQ
jgi:hypothetical protein